MLLFAVPLMMNVRMYESYRPVPGMNAVAGPSPAAECRDASGRMQIVPSREAFFAQLAPAGGDNVLLPEMAAFLRGFQPILAAIATFLDANGLNFDTKV